MALDTRQDTGGRHSARLSRHQPSQTTSQGAHQTQRGAPFCSTTARLPTRYRCPSRGRGKDFSRLLPGYLLTLWPIRESPFCTHCTRRWPHIARFAGLHAVDPCRRRVCGAGLAARRPVLRRHRCGLSQVGALRVSAQESPPAPRPLLSQQACLGSHRPRPVMLRARACNETHAHQTDQRHRLHERP